MTHKLLYIAFFFFTALAANDVARQGNEAYNSGDFAEAERLYSIAIEQEPDNAKHYFNLGNAQAKQGKVEEAIQSYLEFKKRAETAVNKSKAEYNIGTLLAENGKWKPAATHFKNSLILNPGDFDAKHNYERALMEQQNEEEQENEENQPPPDPSEYAKAMKKQAENLVQERRYEEAHELMMNALKADDTVRAFSTFINRIKEVAEINTDSQ